MSKNGMTLVARGGVEVFQILQEILKTGKIPKSPAKAATPKPRASPRPRVKLIPKRQKVVEPPADVPVEGDWFAELESLTAETKKEVD